MENVNYSKWVGDVTFLKQIERVYNFHPFIFAIGQFTAKIIKKNRLVQIAI